MKALPNHACAKTIKLHHVNPAKTKAQQAPSIHTKLVHGLAMMLTPPMTMRRWRFSDSLRFMSQALLSKLAIT